MLQQFRGAKKIKDQRYIIIIIGVGLMELFALVFIFKIGITRQTRTHFAREP